jgi:hypothetical protein
MTIDAASKKKEEEKSEGMKENKQTANKREQINENTSNNVHAAICTTGVRAREMSKLEMKF